MNDVLEIAGLHCIRIDCIEHYNELLIASFIYNDIRERFTYGDGEDLHTYQEEMENYGTDDASFDECTINTIYKLQNFFKQRMDKIIFAHEISSSFPFALYLVFDHIKRLINKKIFHRLLVLKEAVSPFSCITHIA